LVGAAPGRARARSVERGHADARGVRRTHPRAPGGVRGGGLDGARRRPRCRASRGGAGGIRPVSVLELLRTLTELGVELSAEGDRLRIKAPKGALSPELQRSLRDQKEALLEVLTSVRSADAEAPLGAIVAHDPSAPAPLSAAQHRLWFLDQLHPGTAFLNLPFTVRLAGELDLDVLRWVIAEVGRRHDALRSSIRLVGDEPMQLVSEKDLE